MENQEHLDILKRGVREWNMWYARHPTIRPDISEVRFSEADLSGVNLCTGDLSRARLNRADLSGADLSGADLIGTHLIGADLSRVDLSRADLSGASIGNTTFVDTDLRLVHGLETIRHFGPSSIGIDTIYRSAGQIPAVFLRGCGVPDSFIDYIPSLVGAMEPIQYYSCFISYSTKDEDFARRLHERMRAEHLRVWFAPEDIKGGEKLYDQIDRAIQLHDRLLLVLSEQSMQSAWVMTEIRRARRQEIKEQRRKLFPIRLTDFEALRDWSCFDADHGKDLAVEVREYFIPDFSDWKQHDAFETAFARLLRDLRAAETTTERCAAAHRSLPLLCYTFPTENPPLCLQARAGFYVFACARCVRRHRSTALPSWQAGRGGAALEGEADV